MEDASISLHLRTDGVLEGEVGLAAAHCVQACGHSGHASGQVQASVPTVAAVDGVSARRSASLNESNRRRVKEKVWDPYGISRDQQRTIVVAIRQQLTLGQS